MEIDFLASATSFVIVFYTANYSPTILSIIFYSTTTLKIEAIPTSENTSISVLFMLVLPLTSYTED